MTVTLNKIEFSEIGYDQAIELVDDAELVLDVYADIGDVSIHRRGDGMEGHYDSQGNAVVQVQNYRVDDGHYLHKVEDPGHAAYYQSPSPSVVSGHFEYHEVEDKMVVRVDKEDITR